MKIMTTSCTDNITGFMVLATDCSYNFAMDWLARELDKYDVEILSCVTDKVTGYTKIKTGQYSHILGDFKPCDDYYYDEERGYLLRDLKIMNYPY